MFLLLVIGCTARPFYPLPNKADGGSRKPLQTLRPYNIAHRGSNGELPEETHAAYTVKTIFVQNYFPFFHYSVSGLELGYNYCFSKFNYAQTMIR